MKLRQGNIFTSVCQQFCPQGGCAWLHQGGMCGCMGGMRGCTRGGVHGFIQGGVHGFIWGGACVVLFRGHAWFIQGGHAWFSQFFRIQWDQWAGGTHPTGMHSCLWLKIQYPIDYHYAWYVRIFWSLGKRQNLQSVDGGRVVSELDCYVGSLLFKFGIPLLLKHAYGRTVTSCHAGHHEVSKYHTRCISCMLPPSANKAGLLWLWNQEETPPEVQNRGISGPIKRHVSTKICFF